MTEGAQLFVLTLKGFPFSCNLSRLLSLRGQIFLFLVDMIQSTLEVVDFGDHLDVTGIQIIVDLGKLVKTTQVDVLAHVVLLNAVKFSFLLLATEG